MRPQLQWVADHFGKDGKEYDAGECPNLVMNINSRISLMICDPAVIQDMIVTKNAQIDKTGAMKGVFQTLYGDSFVFSKTDDTWKKKRKATAHAFYKDRLVHMLDAFKDILIEQIETWNAEIDASEDGSTEIDLSVDVIKIFQKLLTVVIFGEDLNDMKITIQARNSDGTFSDKELGMNDALEETFQQVMASIGTRLSNPLWHIGQKLTGANWAFTENEK